MKYKTRFIKKGSILGTIIASSSCQKNKHTRITTNTRISPALMYKRAFYDSIILSSFFKTEYADTIQILDLIFNIPTSAQTHVHE
jgi:hypothetical protein